MDSEYEAAVAVARERLADLKERGVEALGDEWADVRRELFTPEENAASDARVALMGEILKAREEKTLSHEALDELSDGIESERFTHVLAILAAMGKTLAVVPLGTEQAR